MIRKRIHVFILFVMLSVVVSSCMPGSDASRMKSPAGFFMGVWHGWIAPVSLVVGLFNPSIRVYETENSGWWYDFGFYIALVGGFGGISLFRKNKNN